MNSSTPGNPNSTGNMFSASSIEFNFSSKIFTKKYFKSEFICYWKSEFHWKDVYKFHGIQFSIESVETVFSNNPKLCSPGSFRNTNCTVQCTWIFWNYIFNNVPWNSVFHIICSWKNVLFINLNYCFPWGLWKKLYYRWNDGNYYFHKSFGIHFSYEIGLPEVDEFTLKNH